MPVADAAQRPGLGGETPLSTQVAIGGGQGPDYHRRADPLLDGPPDNPHSAPTENLLQPAPPSRRSTEGLVLAECRVLAEWPAGEAEPVQFWLSDPRQHPAAYQDRTVLAVRRRGRRGLHHAPAAARDPVRGLPARACLLSPEQVTEYSWPRIWTRTSARRSGPGAPARRPAWSRGTARSGGRLLRPRVVRRARLEDRRLGTPELHRSRSPVLPRPRQPDGAAADPRHGAAARGPPQLEPVRGPGHRFRAHQLPRPGETDHDHRRRRYNQQLYACPASPEHPHTALLQ